jgi:hypothetical protein
VLLNATRCHLAHTQLVSRERDILTTGGVSRTLGLWL